MMKLFFSFPIILVSFVLVGCCPYGCFIASSNVVEGLNNLTPPYLQQWEKSNVTPKERRQDSRSCGSELLENIPNPDGIAFSNEKIEATRLPGETYQLTHEKLIHDWQRCMLGKGYRYIGRCLDNEISRSSPACGAP